MKVAVCVSGLCRGGGKSVKDNIATIQKIFPYDIFLGTWNGRNEDMESELPGYKYFTFPEPEMHYHPGYEFVTPVPQNYARYITNGKAKTELWKHRTKQIIAHAHMMKLIPEDYDLIVRLRFDSWLNTNTPVKPFIDKAYNENRTLGFFTPKLSRQVPAVPKEVPKGHNPRWWQHLSDHLIIHPRKLFDIDLAWKLHNEKKLIAAEWGWYQVLSQPYGDTHITYHGLAGVHWP